jgi:hypothetical protein
MDAPAKKADRAGEKKRKDQTQCPRCFEWGCPASSGSKPSREGRIRHRVCSSCGWVFQTIEPDGQPERVLV